MTEELRGGNSKEQYSGTSIIWTSLGPYQTFLIIEVSLVQRLVQNMHSITSYTPQPVALTCITETTQTAKRRLKIDLTEREREFSKSGVMIL